MGVYVVVLPSPVFDCHRSLGQSPKLLAVEALLLETRVEAFHLSVLPGASRLYVERLDPILGKLAARPALDELRTVVAADIFGRSMPLDQRGHDPPIHLEAQAFPRLLVQHVEHAKSFAAHRGVLTEVPSPDVVAMRRLGRNRGSGPRRLRLGFLAWNGQAEFATQSLDDAGPDRPALQLKQTGDLRLSHSRIFVGDSTNGRLQLREPSVRLFRPVGERAAMQPEVAASRLRGATSPGYKLFGYLPLVPGARSFFPEPPLKALCPASRRRASA